MRDLDRRALCDVYTYGGPLHRGADVAARRRRIALLLRAVRRGTWTPKLGLLRARRHGPAFVRARLESLRAAASRAASMQTTTNRPNGRESIR